MATYNSERGEVPLTVGGVDLVIAATMGGLASVSSRTGCQSFKELYQRLIFAEVAAVIAGIEALTVKGDVIAALKVLSLSDIPACKDAFLAALAHSAKVPGGKPRAVRRRKKASPGGSGKDSPSEI